MEALLKICLAFLKVGAVSFGGGWTIVGYIRQELVGGGLMEPEAFERAVAIAQLTPGPVALNVATMSGWETAGAAGAILGTLSVLAVPLAALFAVAVLSRRISKGDPALRESLSTAALAMTGMTAVNVIASGGLDPRMITLSLASFLLTAFTKAPPALVIFGCGLAGMAWGAASRALGL